MSTPASPPPSGPWRAVLARGGTPLALSLSIALIGGLTAPAVVDRAVPDGGGGARGESREAERLVNAYLGRDPQPAMIVTASDSRLPARSAVRGVAMTALVSQLRSDPAVAAVHRGPISRDRRTASLAVFFGRGSERELTEAARRIADNLDGGPLELRVGGRYPARNAVADLQKRRLARAAAVGLPFILALLALVSGSLARAAVCACAVAVALLATLAAIALLQGITDVSVGGLAAAGLVSLFVALHHSLLLMWRHRREVEAGRPGEDGVRLGFGWTSRSALLASAASAAGILALAVLPGPALGAAVLPGAIAALLSAPVALIASRTGIAVLGGHLEAGSVGRRREPNPAGSPSYRLAASLMPMRIPLVLAVAATLAGLALPLDRAELSAVDSTLLPARASARGPDREFGFGLTAPVLAAVTGHDRRQLRTYALRLGAVRGVDAVSVPQVVGPDLRLIEASTGSGPGSEAARRAVRAIRAVPAPFPVSVGGQAAESLDLRRDLVRGAPLAAALVFLLVAAVIAGFSGSALAALKASLPVPLGTLAALGCLVLTFGDRRLSGILDYDPRGGLGLASLVAVAVVGIAVGATFAASLLSSMSEESEAGADPQEQVVRGVEAVAPASLGAAGAVSVLALAMVLWGFQPLSELGVGLVVVLAIQLPIAGMILSPALLGLLAGANWWPRKVGR